MTGLSGPLLVRRRWIQGLGQSPVLRDDAVLVSLSHHPDRVTDRLRRVPLGGLVAGACSSGG